MKVVWRDCFYGFSAAMIEVNFFNLTWHLTSVIGSRNNSSNTKLLCEKSSSAQGVKLIWWDPSSKRQTVRRTYQMVVPRERLRRVDPKTSLQVTATGDV